MFEIKEVELVTKTDKLLYNICELLKETNDLLRSMRKAEETEPKKEEILCPKLSEEAIITEQSFLEKSEAQVPKQRRSRKSTVSRGKASSSKTTSTKTSRSKSKEAVTE